MKTVILCGGRGFRLQEETEYRPKPLVPIGGKPILWHILQMYASFGHREFILCLGYRGDMIKEYFANYDMLNCDCTVELGKKGAIVHENEHTEQGYRITLADTGLETMTGGRIKRIERYLNEDTFMLTYGDGVSDVHIDDLLAYHYSHKKCATVTVVHPFSHYGVLSVHNDGRVLQFAEKPMENHWISAGFFVFSKKVFDYLEGDGCVLENKPLKRLAVEGELMAYKHKGIFYSMDTYRDYILLNDLWNRGNVAWIK